MSQLKKDMLAHWHAFKNPLINDVLINLERIENLPPMSDHDEKVIQQLLDTCKSVQLEKVDELEFIQLLNQMPAPYMLYTVHKLQSLNPDLVMRLINFAQKHKTSNPDVTLFFDRNMVFEKSQLLGRIFSTNRMQTVLSVL